MYTTRFLSSKISFFYWSCGRERLCLVVSIRPSVDPFVCMSVYMEYSPESLLACYNQVIRVHMTCITRKQTLRSLWLSYQKKDGRAWPRISFFWYDTDLAGNMIYKVKRLKFWKVGLNQNKDGHGHGHPSFFWHDNDKDLKVCFLLTHTICDWLQAAVHHIQL